MRMNLQNIYVNKKNTEKKEESIVTKNMFRNY